MPRTDAKGTSYYEVYPVSDKLPVMAAHWLRCEVARWAACFRKDFPVSKRVRVYVRGKIVRDGDECRGLMVDRKNHFVVYLAWSPDWHAVVDALKEEWVHMRLHPDDSHGVRFDLELGHIERKYRGED